MISKVEKPLIKSFKHHKEWVNNLPLAQKSFTVGKSRQESFLLLMLLPATHTSTSLSLIPVSALRHTKLQRMSH